MDVSFLPELFFSFDRMPVDERVSKSGEGQEIGTSGKAGRVKSLETIVGLVMGLMP